MKRFIQDSVYTRAEVVDAVGEHKLDGPFVIGEKKVALVVNLGDDPGSPALPTRKSLHWPRKAPLRVTERGVSTLLYINEGKDKLRFLGAGYAQQYAHGVRDVSDVHFEFEPSLPRDRWLAMIFAASLSNTPPFPEEGIAKLSNASTSNECWDALELFVRRWYGVTPNVKRERDEESVGPVLLHRLLDLAGQVPRLFHQNELVGADDLAAEDDRVTFLIENQAVCFWATEPDGDDPRVWYRNNDAGEPWIEEPVRLSRFIIQAVLLEAVLDAPFGGHATGIPPETLDAIRTRLDPIGDDRWNWCGARFYARHGALAVLMESPGQWDLFLASRTPLALTDFQDLVTDEWHRVAF